MVTTSRNSRPGLPFLPSASNSASALTSRRRLASSDATVGLFEGGAYCTPISGGALGVISGFALDEGEKVGVGFTMPIWWSRSAKPAGLASGCFESDIVSGRAHRVSHQSPSEVHREVHKSDVSEGGDVPSVLDVDAAAGCFACFACFAGCFGAGWRGGGGADFGTELGARLGNLRAEEPAAFEADEPISKECYEW